MILDVHLHKQARLNILKEFAGFGHDVSLIAVRSGYLPRVEDAQVRIRSVPLRYLPFVSTLMFTIALFLAMPFYILKSQPDFVIFTQPDAHILSSIPGLVVSRFRKVKFVLDVRSTPVETVGFHGFLQKFWFSVSIHLAKHLFHGVTFITERMKEQVCNEFDLDENKVGIWSSGVSTETFDPQKNIEISARLKRKLGLSEKFVVFYHGVFSANRGLSETVQSVKMLKEDHPDVVLYLLGNGPAAPLLESLVEKEGLHDNVMIHGAVNYAEVPAFIGIGDVCISPLPNHPYWRYQCPLKLLEYLAMEKVVIATDIPAHRSVCDAEKCCIYTQSAEPTALAKSVIFAYVNKEQLQEWGKAGRLLVEREYTWERVARNLERYLESLSLR
jgi:glycosyltransferase involved in cell wall biosynthesis